jgi:hypothetical protein
MIFQIPNNQIIIAPIYSNEIKNVLRRIFIIGTVIIFYLQNLQV